MFNVFTLRESFPLAAFYQVAMSESFCWNGLFLYLDGYREGHKENVLFVKIISV